MKKRFKKFTSKTRILPRKWIIRFNGLPILLAALADYAGVIQYANLQLILLALLCLTAFFDTDEKKDNTEVGMQKILNETEQRMTRSARRRHQRRRQY